MRIITEKDLDLLQRYDVHDYSNMREYDDWDYVLFDDLIQLLK